MFKESYFQGTEEPTPHKRKYKSEPAPPVQSRFKEPFYRNYDVYDVTVGDKKLGPGAGWHSMHKYKSISEFLKDKRKRMKDKYTNEKTSSIEMIVNQYSTLVKQAIDFSIDDQISSTFIPPNQTSYQASIPFAGLADSYTQTQDMDRKTNDKVMYLDNEPISYIEDLIQQMLAPKEPPMLGMPDGIEQVEHEQKTEEIERPYQYGLTNDDRGAYPNNMRII